MKHTSFFLHLRGIANFKLLSGFPCNQFGAQEPGTAEEVIFIFLLQIKSILILQTAALVSSEFGVEFRMMEKVDVKGSNVHPLWRYLTGKGVRRSGNFETGVSRKVKSCQLR